MSSQSHKLYILVNKELSVSQRAVQACHAAIEFSLKYGAQWKHESIVLLGVNQDEIDEWYFDFMTKHKDMKSMPFFEPHWDDKLTAIAVHGCDDLVKDLMLL